MAFICIDFDLTIHDQHNPPPGHKLGPPLPLAKESMERLHDSGHYLMIHSCKSAAVIRPWLEYFKIPFDAIWGESPADVGCKPNGDVFVDDKSLYHTSWEQTMKELKDRGFKL